MIEVKKTENRLFDYVVEDDMVTVMRYDGGKMTPADKEYLNDLFKDKEVICLDGFGVPLGIIIDTVAGYDPEKL